MMDIVHYQSDLGKWERLFMGRRLSDALFLDRLKSGSFKIQSRDKATVDAHGISL